MERNYVTVTQCTVASRLDYCNVMLYGAPAATLSMLHRVQNNWSELSVSVEVEPMPYRSYC